MSADCHAVFHLCHHRNAGMNNIFLFLFPSNNVSQIYTFSAHNNAIFSSFLRSLFGVFYVCNLCWMYSCNSIFLQCYPHLFLSEHLEKILHFQIKCKKLIFMWNVIKTDMLTEIVFLILIVFCSVKILDKKAETEKRSFVGQ